MGQSISPSIKHLNNQSISQSFNGVNNHFADIGQRATSPVHHRVHLLGLGWRMRRHDAKHRRSDSGENPRCLVAKAAAEQAAIEVECGQQARPDNESRRQR
jgi:hypothetical protein